jgi:hypothetical protein
MSPSCSSNANTMYSLALFILELLVEVHKIPQTILHIFADKEASKEGQIQRAREKSLKGTRR